MISKKTKTKRNKTKQKESQKKSQSNRQLIFEQNIYKTIIQTFLIYLAPFIIISFVKSKLILCTILFKSTIKIKFMIKFKFKFQFKSNSNLRRLKHWQLMPGATICEPAVKCNSYVSLCVQLYRATSNITKKKKKIYI